MTHMTVKRRFHRWIRGFFVGVIVLYDVFWYYYTN